MRKAVFANKKLNATPVPGMVNPQPEASQPSPAMANSVKYGMAAAVENAPGAVTSSQHDAINATSRNTGESHFNSL